MTSIYNKEYILKEKKIKALEFAQRARRVIKNNNKHFIMIYEYNEKNPDLSSMGFDCSNISLEEIMSVLKQFIVQLKKEEKISGE